MSAGFSGFSGAKSLTINNCQFSENMSAIGGVVYSANINSSTVTYSISNSLFSKNKVMDTNAAATGYAGSSMWLRSYGSGSTLVSNITNCTFVDNSDEGTASGMNNFNRTTLALTKNTSASHTANISNCIFWNNKATAATIARPIGGFIESMISSATIKNSIDETNFTGITLSGTSANTSSSNPLFTNLTSGDYTLTSVSPAKNSGDNASVIGTTDLLGNQRIFDTNVDMGAYEYGNNTPNNCNATDLNLSENILLCDQTSTILSANLPNMSYYIWDFEGTNIGTTEEITVTENGWYYLSVADSCGNAAADSIYVLLDDNCVWPGDCNYDNIVNYLDLLAWSAAYGETGAVRTNASYNWEAQPCEDWNGSQNDNVNYKHADTDGNGIVDLNDLNAIYENYSLTHGTLPPPIEVVASPISLTPVINEAFYFSPTENTQIAINLDLSNNNNIDVIFNPS